MVGAVVRDGTTVWSDAIETDIGAQYRIGSLTKTFVTVMVMRMRDEGKLDLNDPLDKHLGGTLAGSRTIAQLLSHTSGLSSETPGPWWERTPGEIRPELGDVLGEDPFRHPPGRRFHYSNPGFGLLGALVGELRGMPWGEVLRREVLEPLEMRRTSLLPEEPYARGFAVHPFADVAMPEVVQETGLMAPAGQLWSTVDDLTRFATFLSQGADGVLSADSVAEMREPSAAPEPATWDSAYGLGLQLIRVKERMLSGHTGSMPGFLCALWIEPDEGLASVVMTNTTSGITIGSLGADLLTIVADAEPKLPEPWRPLPAVEADVLELARPWFWATAGFALRVPAKGGLELVPLNGLQGRGTRFRDNGDGTWTGLNGYFAGEVLRPVRDGSGRLTHLDLGSFVWTRQPYDPDAPIPGGVPEKPWPTSE
ncbi:MAG TPA: serine hydrolase domain-containing protein [Candidatus Limnocylindrales bacterium]